MQQFRSPFARTPVTYRQVRAKTVAPLFALVALLLAGCQSALQDQEPLRRLDSGLVLVSTASDPTNSRPLDGETVSGDIYVYLSTYHTVLDVRMYLDGRNPVELGMAAASPIMVSARGGRYATETRSWNTNKLSNGRHKITIEIDYEEDGEVHTDTGDVEFVVDNPTPSTGEPSTGPDDDFDGGFDGGTGTGDDGSDGGTGDDGSDDGNDDGTGGDYDGSTPPTNDGDAGTGDDGADAGSDAGSDDDGNGDVGGDDGGSTPPTDGGDASADRLLFGAWTQGGPWSGMNNYYELEQQIGYQLDVVHWYMDMSTRWMGSLVESTDEDGRIPMITWEAYDQTIGEIAAGQHDARLREWGAGAAAYGKTLYIRPFQEMNADFFPWGMDPDTFKVAWRRIVDVFRSQGAHNVLWVWTPNHEDNPRTAENKMEFYYPGANYVDILGFDGYNWGTCTSWSDWKSYEEVMADAYRRVAALGDQPIWVAEFGSTDMGGDKGQWIRDAIASDAFPRVEALIYFDEDKSGHCDWRVDSSSTSLAGFRDALDTLEWGGYALTAQTR